MQKDRRGAVVLCVGSHGVGESAIRSAGAQARRAGQPLRLLHVAESDAPLALRAADGRLQAAEEDARRLLGRGVVVEPALASGDVVEGVAREAEEASLLVLERPAVVRLGGLSRRTSLTGALVERIEAPILTVPGLWSPARVPVDDLPPSWVPLERPRTVAVLLDDPAECAQVVAAGFDIAAEMGGTLELVRGWEADRRAVVEASRSASTMVVGRGGSEGGLSLNGRVALHESVCPVLVVEVPEAAPLAEVIPFRRAR